MGLFDSVYVNCPGCGKPMEFQSKAMPDPQMVRFTLEDAPSEVLYDIINSPQYHKICGTWVALTDPEYPPDDPPRPNPFPQKVKAPLGYREHGQGFRWWPEGRKFTFDDLEP